MTDGRQVWRLSLQLFFDSTDMFLLWSRNRTPNSLWSDMPYAPRDRAGITRLIDYYRQTFGSDYEYEFHQVGSYPTGMRQPCFV